MAMTASQKAERLTKLKERRDKIEAAYNETLKPKKGWSIEGISVQNHEPEQLERMLRRVEEEIVQLEGTNPGQIGVIQVIQKG